MTSNEFPIQLGAGSGVDAQGSGQRTRLLEASRNGRGDEVQTLLGNISNGKGDINYALREASAGGHVGVVKILLRAGADSNAEPERCEMHSNNSRNAREICGNIICGRTALQSAAKGGNTEIVSVLLEAGADIEAQCDGVTVLQVAVEGGHTEIVSVLLEAGADVEAQCDGVTVLQVAVEGGDVEIVSILLKAGASIEAQFDRKTALQAAVEGGFADIVSILLKAGANVNAPPSSYSGRTALHVAAEDGHAEILSILLNAGANIEMQLDGRTALQAAAESGQVGTMSMLLEAGATIEARLDGRTTLQVAAGSGHADVVSILLKAGAWVNALPGRTCGRTALQAAAEGGYIQIVSTLLKDGADVNAPASEYGGKTALYAATEGGHVEVVSILLQAGANVEAQLHGRTALQVAARSGHTEIVSILLGAGANIDPSPSKNSGRTALLGAVESGHAEVVSILLKAGANIEARLDGKTALQVAAQGGNASVVSILLKAGADIEATPSEYSGRTALLAAAENGHAEVLRVLLKAGANINATLLAYGNRAALQTTAGLLPTLRLKTGVNINDPPSVWGGRTALQAAVEEGHAEIISVLLGAGANICDAFSDPMELREAVENENPEIVDIPLDIWPLWIAAKRGHGAVIRVLMGHDVSGGSSTTTIQLAAKGGHKDTVRALLDAGADINARDKYGRTCLTWAVPHPEVVQLLLEKGADMHLQALDGATPLHYAIKGQHEESAVLLLRAGANTESEDYQNRKPLDILIHDLESGSTPTAFLQQLLEHGCDVGRRGMSNWRTILGAKDADVIRVTETRLPYEGLDSQSVASSDGNDPSPNVVQGKPSIKIDLDETSKGPPPFIISDYFKYPVVRRLFSASGDKILFPALGAKEIKQLDITTGSVIEWQWFQLNQFGTPSGYGLFNVAKLVTDTEKQALLSCYIRFEMLMQAPDCDTGDERSLNLGKPFRTDIQTSEISWIMRKACAKDFQSNAETRIDTNSYPIFRSVDFRSTIDIGWIPDSGIDFFTLFILHIHEKWRVLFEKADSHQVMNRKILLKKKGRTTDFIDNLLLDAQQWSNFRALLQTHVSKARDLVQDFKEQRHLFDQQGDRMEVRAKQGKTEAAIKKLSKAIQRMETEVENEIKKLDKKTKEMILLEFNLVSIYEARTSKVTGMSMKRLSWITFIFLPLMFVASVFGMNIDLINGGPRWWWVVVLSVAIFMLVISVWGLFKIVRMEEWSETHDGATISERLQAFSGNLGRGWRGTMGKMRLDDLESGNVRASGGFEFNPPPRRWTKLKDL